MMGEWSLMRNNFIKQQKENKRKQIKQKDEKTCENNTYKKTTVF
jgi:hypothetical protein